MRPSPSAVAKIIALGSISPSLVEASASSSQATICSPVGSLGEMPHFESHAQLISGIRLASSSVLGERDLRPPATLIVARPCTTLLST